MAVVTLGAMRRRSAKGCRNTAQVSSGTSRAQRPAASWLGVGLWSVCSDFRHWALYDSVNRLPFDCFTHLPLKA